MPRELGDVAADVLVAEPHIQKRVVNLRFVLLHQIWIIRRLGLRLLELAVLVPEISVPGKQHRDVDDDQEDKLRVRGLLARFRIG